MRIVALALAFAACKGHGDYPIEGGGGPGPGGGAGGPDAAVADSGDGGPTIAGRVCLAADPRKLSACSATGALGLTVALGGQMTTTADDGTFAIARPGGTNLLWNVSGAAIMTSRMSFSAVAEIPAIAMTTYMNLETSNGVLPV